MKTVILSVSLLSQFATALAIVGALTVLAIICLLIVVLTFKPNDPDSGIYWEKYLLPKQRSKTPHQSHGNSPNLDDNTKMGLPYHNGIKVR